MLEQDGYPAGVPCYIDIEQPDPEAATEFYGGLFGWEFEDRVPADLPDHYFAARLGGRDVAGIGSQQPGSPPPQWLTYIAVDSADATAAAVRAAGGRVLVEPLDVFDAGRMAVCADPQGAVFCLWQANQHKGAAIVNAPGTWNWSDLKTRDVDGAKAFYGAVFGWEPSTVQFGELEAVMWRRPGYGDALAPLDPGIRDRHDDAGVPVGFADAIGWLMEMTSDEFPDDAPPHWAVTFAVDGTDEVADRAAQLGGTVVVAPFDIGPTRLATLRDPQGATFSVSSYAPER
ncbi:MAG: VOC family protein [Solirubrobacteraceae bacterium]|nr:VOC family protein [Solirubrobacteraceae bacterium]